MVTLTCNLVPQQSAAAATLDVTVNVIPAECTNAVLDSLSQTIGPIIFTTNLGAAPTVAEFLPFSDDVAV